MLLKQAAGRLDDDAALTLDVWNTKLTDVGETIGQARADLVGAWRRRWLRVQRAGAWWGRRTARLRPAVAADRLAGALAAAR